MTTKKQNTDIEEVVEELLKTYHDEDGCWFVEDLYFLPNEINKALTTHGKKMYEKGYEKGKQLAVIDYIPDYKTKEQFEIFIDSRNKDIGVLKDTIKKAKKELQARNK